LGAVQVAAAGAPEQPKEALPAKPGPGVNCRLKAAVCPAFTVTEVEPGAAGEIARAALTVALMAIDCGELVASSVIVTDALRAPVAAGENDTPMLQVAPTA
jgi:hypothetical protein